MAKHISIGANKGALLPTSVAAHGVDVAITLARPRHTSELALRAFAPVLVALLGGDPNRLDEPGRPRAGHRQRPLSRANHAALGPLAARFPLLP